MARRFKVYNGAIPTTGPQVGVTLTNAQKTQLQVTAPAVGLEIVEFGINFGTAASLQQAVQVELMVTTTVAGTGMTAVVATKLDDPTGPAAGAVAGFTPSAEGSIVTPRMLESEQITPLGSWFKQYPLGERPGVGNGEVVRIRTNTPALSPFPVVICWIVWAE